MTTTRRVYIFAVCAISLQGVTWALIALLRALLPPGRQIVVTDIALEIAIIVIGLPIFLGHWLWAQRLAAEDPEERGAILRVLYLYGTLAGFLGPILGNAFSLLSALFGLVFGVPQPRYSYYFRQAPSTAEMIVQPLLALVVLALLWWYHRRVLARDARVVVEAGNAATVRRLYVFGFSATGLVMTTVATIGLLRVLLPLVPSVTAGSFVSVGDEIARLFVGVVIWAIFWDWAQRLFGAGGEEEREADLRKVYLYLTLFAAEIGTVVGMALLLNTFLRQLWANVGAGDLGDGLRTALPVVVTMGLLWASHAYLLRQDAARAGEALRQRQVRQIYFYLLAGVGLGAFLLGLGSGVVAWIRVLADVGFTSGMRDQLAWSVAMLVAGLPVWLVAWRQVEMRAVEEGPAGELERRATARKVYLYFYLFFATMTVLASLVFVVYRLLSLALGQPVWGNLGSELGQALALCLLAVGVWLYHGWLLRGDRRLAEGQQVRALAGLRVLVLDVEEGQLGKAILEGLQHELPGLRFDFLNLSRPTEAGEAGPEAVAARCAGVDLIVGPWTIAVPGGAVTTATAQAVAASPARKVLIPAPAVGWQWVGVERYRAGEMAQEAVQAVKQIAKGEEVRPGRRLSAGMIILIVLAAMVGLGMLWVLLSTLLGVF